MTTALVIPMPGNETLAASLAASLQAELGRIETRAFPDGETYLQFLSELTGRHVILICTLDRPDTKVLPLLFAADTAKELGAAKVTLVAPYLCYMRQDRRFHPGEAVTSVSFARLLSSALDALVTVDPHLHRYHSLSEIYSIPAAVAHSAPLIAQWVVGNERAPLLIGPDMESEQWVSEVASLAKAPYRLLSKQRFGDRHVEITLPDLREFGNRTPVLIDDIVSSGRTMIETARKLAAQGIARPTCIAVHALFAKETEKALLEVAARIVSTNTVVHPTNAIDLSSTIAEVLMLS